MKIPEEEGPPGNQPQFFGKIVFFLSNETSWKCLPIMPGARYVNNCVYLCGGGARTWCGIGRGS